VRLLTDCKGAARELLPVPPPFGTVRAEELPAEDRALWTALSEESEVSVAEVPDIAFWARLVVVEEAPASQFDALRDLYGSGPAVSAPVACLALGGREFHGHRGRSWAAVPGNLHLSAAFSPGAPAGDLAPALTMLPAVAVVDAIRAATGDAVRPGIKWVNDILLDGRKIAGVLTATASQGDRLDLAVLGVGLNVAAAPDVSPTPFVPRIGCLRDVEGGADLPVVFRALLDALGGRYRSLLSDGPEPVFRAYREASVVIGRRVRVFAEAAGDDPGPPLAEGVVRDISPDLSLLLEGRPEPVAKGRLALSED
jgi:BirA family biotin operon repressor/biotin-[acetyl-CoA-carboxylase] ligase